MMMTLDPTKATKLNLDSAALQTTFLKRNKNTIIIMCTILVHRELLEEVKVNLVVTN